ncbi:response regulator [Calidifontibacter sp. DB0510]|uniref:Response regulator n=1 Tax=Metallococcus carri TaxID=1656884 RepID=A0A967E941_9MICO|nr:response regulator [Metallococcus carri]NHN55952.1 response regulator [Metallococcus carri]NOP37591.1 response regulator transcription factor [Calidifontibacter sp. DB2511S]
MTSTSPQAEAIAPAARTAEHRLTVLLYSDDSSTRDAVRVGVGRRPARDVEIAAWRECATAPAVIEAVEKERYDLLILDGEATPVGGMGLCKQLKNEIEDCPPVLVLTGRAADGWLASWSQADAAVPHPLDPLLLTSTIATLARQGD